MAEQVERGERPHRTLARRVLGVVKRLGVTVEDVAPGTVVLSRRVDMQVQHVPRAAVVARRDAVEVQRVPGAAVVARAGSARVEQLSDAAAVVMATRGNVQVQHVPGAAVVASADSASVEQLGDGAALVLASGGRGLADRQTEKDLYDRLLSHHLAHVFDLYDVNCVLDVGANRGQYGMQLRGAGYRGRIVSFEPVPEVAARLRKAAQRDPDWVVHEIALGREDGSTELNVVPGTMSSLLPATDFGARRYTQLREPVVHEVQVRRLDGMMDTLLAGLDNPRPFLKLDTQGFDIEVFAGLGDRAADIVAMQSEVALVQIYERMPRLPEALAVYESAGFEVSGFFPVSREGKTGRVLEFDCVLVRPEAR